jgi:uncharacterized cupin superfamily protein
VARLTPEETAMTLRLPAAGLAALSLAFAASCALAAEAPKIQRLAKVAGAGAERGAYPASMVVKDGSGFDGSYLEAAALKGPKGEPWVRIWESGPGVLQTDGYPYDEYCNVLEGQLEITNAAGGLETYGPGDTFVIPKGWRGTWNMKTRFRKQYIALSAPDGASAP